MRKLNDNGFGIIEALLIIVVIAILSFVGYRTYQVYTGNNRDDHLSQLGNDKTLKPEDVTAKIKATIAAKYTVVDFSEEGTKENEVSVDVERRSPAYKSEGYSFYTDYDGGSSIDFRAYDSESDSPAAEKLLRKEVANIYKKLGLAKKTSYGGKDGIGYKTEVYEGKGIVCTVAPEASVSPSSASCGVISEYRNAASRAKPFFDALPDDEASDSTVLARLTIEDSKVEGYQKADANIYEIDGFSGYHGIFYKKDSGWKYFTGTQQAIDCKKFNTPDLKNAFKGEPCYKEGDDSAKVE